MKANNVTNVQIVIQIFPLVIIIYNVKTICQFKECISKNSLPHWGNSRLISNLQSETASVEVGDGSIHPILASGPLVTHPHIHASYVPSFSNNLLVFLPL